MTDEGRTKDGWTHRRDGRNSGLDTLEFLINVLDGINMLEGNFPKIQ